jgi:DNA-binding transcriptional LysR family regulator
MDLNDIALFVQVVRAGSFAEAGRRLGIPPSTASRRLQSLEEALGARLLHRSTRRLALTDAGRSFFAECATQVDALEQAAGQVTEAATAPAGRVRVGAPADFFNWFPAERVARFLAEYPRVRLEFELDDARADLLGQGIDVALRAGADLEPTLIAHQLGWSHAAMVASPAYLDARGTPTDPRDLSGHDCISRTTRGGARATWRLIGPRRAVTVEVDGPFQANAASAQLAAAVAGMGIALLPSAMSAAHVAAGRLRVVMPQHSLEPIGVYLVYLSRRQLPRAVSAFIEFAMASVRELGLVQPVTRTRRVA